MNQENKELLKVAFLYTLPILTGFLFLGSAYGILMSSKGYGAGWTILISTVVLAGSAQYVAITFLTSVFSPINALVMTLLINARHLFYGISMLDKFKNTGKLKPYLIFGLCDETFSLICSAKPPEGADKNKFMFFITILNHIYWVAGSALGGLLGSFISINIKGLDFVLTALFVVIFVDQWKASQNRIPAIVGVLSSLLCLIIFGQNNFIIPSMVLIMVVLAVLKKII